MEVEDVEERTPGNVRCALWCSNGRLWADVRTNDYVQHHAVALLLRECHTQSNVTVYRRHQYKCVASCRGPSQRRASVMFLRQGDQTWVGHAPKVNRLKLLLIIWCMIRPKLISCTRCSPGAHLLERLDTACVAKCLIDLADTSDTPEIRMSLESVVDEGNTNVVSSRKPEVNPRVGSANASVRTMQDRHAALVAMISTKMADKQEKRDDLTRHFITAISKDMPLLTQVCAPDFSAPS
jgi:hypothetical protein